MRIKMPVIKTPCDGAALMTEARVVARRAYCPYSRFRVGAAFMGADGNVYSGCNVENASYGLTVCAERVALFSAIAAGVQEFAGLALVAGRGTAAMPCGACLQTLSEFCEQDMPIFMAPLTPARAPMRVLRLKDLLPHGFQLTGRGAKK